MPIIKVFQRKTNNICGDEISSGFYIKVQKKFLGMSYLKTVVDGYSGATTMFEDRTEIDKYLKENFGSYSRNFVEEIKCGES